MELRNTSSEIFIPDTKLLPAAIKRTTHIGIVAHQDDLEISAYDGILRCFRDEHNWFFGVTVTNGAGSPRTNCYTKFSDQDMQNVRKNEQKKAAIVGEYAGVAFLDYASSSVKDPKNHDPSEDIKTLIAAARPLVVYTHNPIDKHDTHVAVAIRTIQSLQELPENLKPQHVYGCEVWRDLDWILDQDKVVFDVSNHENLANALLGVFDSQICGGKRYDLATIGRRRAHATFAESHNVDTGISNIFCVDLTPLIWKSQKSILEYTLSYIDRFRADVADRIKRLS